MSVLHREARSRIAERHDPVFQVAGVGLALLDYEGCFLRVNSALERLFLMTEEDLAGKRLYDCCPPSDADACFDMVQELLLTDGAVLDQEITLRRRGKRPFWAHVTVSRLGGTEDMPSCLVLTVHDSSDYFELQEEMKDSASSQEKR